uniref:Peptidylprolyl isomerase n=1 Tax=Craspedostauros australis TaxID=1486917 RepID=A0A7R9WR86_9STRA|mmetsp:Transcript_16458/g.45602  ORF Transcript_16458/g.45602 Transcript_16458/m.45602 type:complete len:343 (+) Transcript_16458:84-1112(+)|eukprot:CAMPEP_0198110718 /NCGR_PEP_ID=MMETSP1442-20131203/2721_1 /TAXON_ID= /ORGANISM="Craspedostauros australis, Strain CCMP3328" /LENGTH=342 /DNA_ID=CAMNT_0043766891 /DNA_START=55 /DNA_END=1083 /DNA_ORIENTATION=+
MKPSLLLTTSLVCHLACVANAAILMNPDERAADVESPETTTRKLRKLIDNNTMIVKGEKKQRQRTRKLSKSNKEDSESSTLKEGTKDSTTEAAESDQQTPSAGSDDSDEDSDEDTTRDNSEDEDMVYSRSTKSPKTSKSSKTSKSGSSGSGSGDSSDPTTPEVPIFMMFNGYVDTSMLHSPVSPDPEAGDAFLPGTTYVFANERLFNVFDGEVLGQEGRLQGQCIRTDANPPSDADNYEGRGYCQWTLEFYEAMSDPPEIIATLSAEGPVSNDDSSKLVVTSGSGGLFGVTGDVIVIPSAVDDGGLSDADRDFLDLPNDDGFELRIEVAVMPRFDLEGEMMS